MAEPILSAVFYFIRKHCFGKFDKLIDGKFFRPYLVRNSDFCKSGGNRFFAVIISENFAELFAALSECHFDKSVEQSYHFRSRTFFFQFKNSNCGINIRWRSKYFRRNKF